MIPESESDSRIRIGIKAWFVEIGIGIGTHDAGIGIKVLLGNTGIRINSYWNRNWNRNHGFW